MPDLSVSPLTLTFTAPFGGPNPADQPVFITNVGAGPLTYTAASDEAWLTVFPTSGSAADTLAVSVDQTSLAVGVYTGNITVTGTTAGCLDTPQIVVVTFTVTAPPPTIFVQAVPNVISSGDSSTINWVASNATTLVSPELGTLTLTGSTVVSPTATSFYHFTATGTGGTVTGYVEVQVLNNKAGFSLQKIILTLKQDKIPVRGRNK